MKTILVTGANGQVGMELQALAANYPSFQMVFAGRNELDIANGTAVNRYFENNIPDYCINCAAYTAVDKAESDQETAWRINVKGTENIARACAPQTVLIHLSTDYVYHNQQNMPFREKDATSPQGAYARTKLEGERAAMAAHPRTMVIRTSWVYSTFGHNFVKTMLRLGRERESLNVVFDQIGTPTYARDLAQAILSVIQKAEENPQIREQLNGIYHYSNEGVASWYDFALAIFEMEGISCKVLPIETKDYPTPAVRPPFSVLNKSKFKTAFHLEIPHWRDALHRCLAAFSD